MLKCKAVTISIDIFQCQPLTLQGVCSTASGNATDIKWFFFHRPRYPGTFAFESLQFESDSVHTSEFTMVAIIIANVIGNVPESGIHVYIMSTRLC